jgi:hypothetical protein
MSVWQAIKTASVASFMLLVAACSGNVDRTYPESSPYKSQSFQAPKGSLLGGDGLNILGGDDKDKQSAGSGIGVNAFLWRASLDTLSFMPVASADPFGGVIITDWYTPPGASDERFKLNVYIIDRQLRADGVRVSAFREVRKGNDWVSAQVADDTARKLEDSILTRARQLRIDQDSATQ